MVLTSFLSTTSLPIFLILFSLHLHAENNFYIKAYNGLSNGRLCREVSPEELKKLDNSCKYPLKDLYTSNEEIFEWSIFQKSADLQIQKNKCINQRLEAIMNDKNLHDRWLSILAASWAGRKKAQLILSQCVQINYNSNERMGARLNPNFRPKINPNKKDLAQSDKDELKWQELCANEDSLDALATANKLFEYSLPVVGGPDFFDYMDQNRSLLINTKTGKPLSNADLLNTDLSDPEALSFVTQDDSRKGLSNFFNLSQKINGKFITIVNERKQANRKLVAQKDKKNGTYNLNEKTKDYLFEDDTVYETLVNTKQIEKPKPNQEPELSMGTKCLLNHYEPSLGGELTEFAILSTVFTGIITKLYGISRLAKIHELTKGKATIWGTGLAGGIQGTREAFKVCSSKLYQDTKLIDQNKAIEAVTNNISDLPKMIGYERPGFEIPMEKTPACKNLSEDTIINDMGRSSCLTTALISLAPLQISLPTLAISHFEK